MHPGKADAHFPGNVAGGVHRHIRGDEAHAVVAIDLRHRPGNPGHLDLGAWVDQTAPQPLDIHRNAADAVAFHAAQVGLDQITGDQRRILGAHPGVGKAGGERAA